MPSALTLRLIFLHLVVLVVGRLERLQRVDSACTLLNLKLAALLLGFKFKRFLCLFVCVGTLIISDMMVVQLLNCVSEK